MKIRNPIQLALPKGRMLDSVLRLMEEAGCPATLSERNYRVQLPLDGISTKLLKPQGIVEMLAAGRRDIGFAGADWVAELGADLAPCLRRTPTLPKPPPSKQLPIKYILDNTS